MLIDFHHACLFEAHQLTFGDRFGAEIYAPYGMDWFDQWFWSFEREYHGDAVARQYLVSLFAGGTESDGIITVDDRKHPGRTIKGISLERARSERWDVALSTVPSNANGFEKFAEQTGARWGIHVGNQWGDEAWQRRPSFAILTTTSVVPSGVPHVIVHQEFSLSDFRYEPPPGFGPVRSFVNCFPETTSEYQENFVPIARMAPELDWRVFGAYGTAPADEFAGGNIPTDPLEGILMRGAGAIWHAKKWSDGFGHVIHRAFAVGRPVFGYAGYYADKLAGPLWDDGVTSIDVGRRSNDEVLAELRRLRDNPDHYQAMCFRSAARFREVVSFEEDAHKVGDLLGLGVPA
jgi:hypothetical protein